MLENVKYQQSNKLPVVFMDETGNKESDRFFVCGFLEVPDVNNFQIQLQRIRDQIKGLADRKRKEKVLDLKEKGNLDELFNFAYRKSSFELKFDKITSQNLSLFQDIIKVLARKIDIRFTAIVIDREDPSYNHRALIEMYKIITHKFFNFRLKSLSVFMPDDFDTGLSWGDIVSSDKIAAVIPAESHSSLALQCCDILGGIVGLALKDKNDYSNRDIVRSPIVETFESEFSCKIKKEFTVWKPKYISVWTLDFSKVKTKK